MANLPYRIGHGFDLHRMEEGLPLIIGGVKIEHSRGAVGHSDGDVVYHCAATAYEGLSVFSPHLVIQNIVTASTSLFSASNQNKVKRIVLCSSMARYGNNRVPFVETYATKPEDPYGIGKVAVEDILVNLCTVHGTDWVIAVPHNIVGPRQKYDDPYRNVAAIMINLMLQGRQPIIYGDGSQKRCFSFIDDCIYCLKEMAFRDNVVGEGALTFRDLGLEPTPAEAILPTYLHRFRPPRLQNQYSGA